MTGLTQKSLNRIEDAQWLLAAGEHPAHVARRVGVSVTGLDHLLRRAGIRSADVMREVAHVRRQDKAVAS